MTPAEEMPEIPEGSAPDAEAFAPFLRRALTEDEAAADRTTGALVDPARAARAEVIVKAPGIICGLDLAAAVFRLLDPDVRVESLADDGDTLGAGTAVLRVKGRAHAILRAERTALNVLQRLSGVATHTATFVEATMATGAEIYDTRKTTPGWRALEKYAVRCGGGRNHRMHLADAAMVKENHLRAAYGETGPDAIRRAVTALCAALEEGVRIYVEVESAEELAAAVAAAGTRAGDVVVMLDDFDLEAVRRAVLWLRTLPPPHPVLEVTGGVTLERVEALAATGVKRLSTGSLTHSAPALDISLSILPEERVTPATR